MKEDKITSDFNVWFRDMPNNYFSLGETMYEENLARKILRSLPKRFDMKFTTIEISQNINIIKVDELICSLLTFEMAIKDKSEKRNKGVSFKVDVENDVEQVES